MASAYERGGGGEREGACHDANNAAGLHFRDSEGRRRVGQLAVRPMCPEKEKGREERTNLCQPRATRRLVPPLTAVETNGEVAQGGAGTTLYRSREGNCRGGPKQTFTRTPEASAPLFGSRKHFCCFSPIVRRVGEPSDVPATIPHNLWRSTKGFI